MSCVVLLDVLARFKWASRYWTL